MPPFKVYAFLVPDVEGAGTILRYHTRIDTYAPGFKFTGGEISWFPFGFIYANQIGKSYDLEKLTDITSWFSEKRSSKSSGIMVRFHSRITGVDSIQSLFVNRHAIMTHLLA